jgi:beta-lactamase class A
MLILSDNAATDVILREVGGTAAVTARLRSLGIADMRVDRTVMQIYWDYVGLGEPPSLGDRNLDAMTRRMASRTPEQLAAAQRAYHADVKDRATPRAMIGLLAAIWRREAVSPASTDLLLSIMQREETGANRIRGRLPPGVTVANKTGTYGTVVVNDVGIVYLPGGAGHLAIAVFTEDSTTAEGPKERIIADVARAAYDFFALGAPRQ